MSFLFIGKKSDPRALAALDFLQRSGARVDAIFAKRGDPLPDEARGWSGKVLISYLSPWVLPPALLKAASVAAINFHPGPPEYPGIGCTNFAVYEGAREYGVTCHHMASSVDTGPIIAVRRFPVFERDAVHSITERCYAQILPLFYEIAALLIAEKPLPTSAEKWTRRAFLRRELDELGRLTREMDDHEMARRIRAMAFPGMPGAFIEVAGRKYYLVDEPVSA
jgi:methionyl-tRNA formyltransferase